MVYWWMQRCKVKTKLKMVKNDKMEGQMRQDIYQSITTYLLSLLKPGKPSSYSKFNYRQKKIGLFKISIRFKQ
jgi:hypothetical protein